jgi:hypothetical protein
MFACRAPMFGNIGSAGGLAGEAGQPTRTGVPSAAANTGAREQAEPMFRTDVRPTSNHMPDPDPQPVLYLAFPQQPGIPERLLRESVRVFCSHCDAALIAHGPTFRKITMAAAMARRRLLVVCGKARAPQAVPDA